MLGAVGVLSFAPVGWFPLDWLSLGGLFALLVREAEGERRTLSAALIAAAFGFGLFLAGVSWVYVSLSVFGGMPMPLAAVATVLFCAVLALFPAASGALFVRLAAPAWWQRCLLFAALWALCEWTRGWAFTGFPWLAAGYSQTPPSPLAGYAPLFGVYGISLVSALVGAMIAVFCRHGCRATDRTVSVWRRIAPLLAIALVLAGGELLRATRWTEASGDRVSVALLQGNVAQEMKWRPEKFSESLRTYYRLALDHPAQLTILPETALPAFLDQIPAEYLDALRQLALRRNGDLLLGIAVAEDGRYFNAALSIGASGEQRYRKMHLVPFGEFVPPGFAWFMAMANIPMSNFTAGPPGQPPLHLAGQRIGVNVCYEDAFGEEIIATLPTATLLVNVSNVAWFGDSLAPAQHLQIARMRAMESGRMMLRATNTGMTAIVDVDGHVVSALPPFTRGALLGEVQGYAGATPYVRWGNRPVLVFAALLISLSSGGGAAARKCRLLWKRMQRRSRSL